MGLMIGIVVTLIPCSMYRWWRGGRWITTTTRVWATATCCTRSFASLPRAPRAPVETHEDPFAWLQNLSDPRTRAYLAAEREYTREWVKGTQPLQRRLTRELRAAELSHDVSIPEVWHGFEYYCHYKRGVRGFPLLCRKPVNGGEEEVVVDPNNLSNCTSFGSCKLSSDHSMVAYTVDATGNDEHFRAEIRDLVQGVVVDTIPSVVSVEWGGDNDTILYTQPDNLQRPWRVRRRHIGSASGEDEILYEEPCDSVLLDVTRTKDRRFVVINANTKTFSEVRLLDTSVASWAMPRIVHPREPNLEYYVDHRNDQLFIVTNDGVPGNYRLVSAPVDAPQRTNWKEVIPVRAGTQLEDMDLFQDYLVLYERVEGVQRIRVWSFVTGEEYEIGLPETVYTLQPGANPDFHSQVLRFQLSSPTIMRRVYDCDLMSQRLTLREDSSQRISRRRGKMVFRSTEYVCRQEHAISQDGTRVPLTLVHRTDLSRNGRNPVLLHGYGAYGHCLSTAYEASHTPLLTRGWIVAFAHVRGGGELGRAWYDGGRRLNKRNTFDDFIACAEHLVAHGFSSPDRMAARGVSAGGLVMGAVANLRPDLFRSLVMKVPFVDILSTMLDPTLPFTIHEYDEWGNPTEQVVFNYIRSYSPCENVHPQRYPNLFVSGVMRDARVNYWEPLKWMARLREANTGENLLLLRMAQNGGHYGAGEEALIRRELALELAFLLTTISIPPSACG